VRSFCKPREVKRHFTGYVTTALGSSSWSDLPALCKPLDSGWRIDYQVATDGLAARAQSAVVERAATYAERWSDHAPVTVVYTD
jgi:exodeoxyribonuclease III